MAGVNSRRFLTKRQGFTLVELLIVILIIGVLASLLLRALFGVQVRAVQTQQVTEITQIGLALDAFKNQFGIYPPSRIRLREGTAYRALPGTNPADPMDVLSVEFLRRVWPNIDITIVDSNQAEPTPANTWMIWCQDDTGETEANRAARSGYTARTYELEGDECLVFFLGGIATVNRADPTQTIVLSGFSRIPGIPATVIDANYPQTIARDGPYYTEFSPNRLFLRGTNGTDFVQRGSGGGGTDLYTNEFPGSAYDYLEDNNATAVSGKALCLPSYRPVKGIQNGPPIAYFSAYGGRGYRPDDFNFPGEPPAPATPPYVQVLWPTITVEPNYTQSYGPNPYSISRLGPIQNSANTAYLPYDDPAISGGTFKPDTSSLAQYYKPDTYQLISPGPDGTYGQGGKLGATSMNGRVADFDNISNVSGGMTIGEFNETARGR